VLRKLLNTLRGTSDVVVWSLDAELAKLEEQATAPALDYRAAVFGRAGDLCVKAEETRRALTYYGKAIDGYLGAGYYDSAMAMCKKVISVQPSVVRAHCTLAFLLIGEDLPYLTSRGVSNAARDQLLEYVRAAKAAGSGPVAVQRLRMMTDVTEVEAVRRVIADLLFELGAADEAAEVHYALFEEAASLAPPDPDSSANQRKRWAEMLRVAIMDE
jgi:hypothetical protein